MKKFVLLSFIIGALPLTMVAQDDDMYFVPSKKSAAKSAVRTVRPAPVYYSGSYRDVDEYNRRGGSYYQVVPTDSTGNDIIDFSGGVGVYPDSAYVEDYALTREMSRWDGYEPEEIYEKGYRDGRWNSSWGWHSPWYYSSYYPWYDSWYYDPWYYSYYGWYGGWYDPWYYDYYYYSPWRRPYWYGYYYPYYGGGGGIVYSSGRTGTERHGHISYSGPRGISNGRSTTYSAGTFGGRSIGSANRSLGGSRSTASRTNSRPASSGRVTNSYGNFGGSRSSSTYSSSSSSSSRSYTPSYSTGSSSSSSSGSFGGGGSYGGSRSSGGGGGGSRSSGGGGHFGGRR